MYLESRVMYLESRVRSPLLCCYSRFLTAPQPNSLIGRNFVQTGQSDCGSPENDRKTAEKS